MNYTVADIQPKTRIELTSDGNVIECTHVGKIRGADKITYSFKYVKSATKMHMTLVMDVDQFTKLINAHTSKVLRLYLIKKKSVRRIKINGVCRKLVARKMRRRCER